MNRIDITQEVFEKCCYSATNCDNHVFEAVAPQIESVQEELFRTLGLDVVKEPSPIEVRNITTAVCVKAYADTIPHLDLVLTGSGFGVVSTENITPASSERVNRLHKKLLDVYDDVFDTILSQLRNHREWYDSDIAKEFFSTFFWSGEYFRRSAFPEIYRRDCAKYRPLVTMAEAKIRYIVGDELVDELLTAIRQNNISSHQTQVIHIIHGIISAEITDTHSADIRQLLQTLLRFLDITIDSFPTYKASSAYQARKGDRYENKKEDGVFFWGI